MRARDLDAALEHIGELAERDEPPEEIIDRLRELYESRLSARDHELELDEQRGKSAARTRKPALCGLSG